MNWPWYRTNGCGEIVSEQKAYPSPLWLLSWKYDVSFYRYTGLQHMKMLFVHGDSARDTARPLAFPKEKQVELNK